MLQEEVDDSNTYSSDYVPKTHGASQWGTVTDVQLYEGNLVLDCPVPAKLVSQLPAGEQYKSREYTHMRYSAATCDPVKFGDERYTLRQRLFEVPRHVELFIVVTMYNEDEVLLARTLMGVIKNIQHMEASNENKMWGKDSWKKIVVCVVSDGVEKINERSRAILAALGVYQEGVSVSSINGKPTTAHIYEVCYRTSPLTSH
jgi:chitin synthase